MEQITLDLIPKGSLPVLHASQYDDGRQWKVNLKENGEDYTLTDETIVLDVRKGDGCAVTCVVTVESGKKYVILTSTEQMCAVAGQNLAELQITKGNMKIGTLNFILQVERDPLNGSVSSASEIHDLQHQVDECVDSALADLGASGLPYDNTESGLEATNVQQAIDEVNEKASDIASELDDKADKSNTYTKSEVNDIADTKADANNVYAKSETYTKTEVDTLIRNLPEPMIFKGTLGVGGTITELPTASTSNEGYTYKVITEGTYAGTSAKVGDVFVSDGSTWVLIPAGDEDNDTWRAIKVNGVEKLGNAISSGSVDFVDTTNVKFEFDSNGNAVKATLNGIDTSAEVDAKVEALIDDESTTNNKTWSSNKISAELAALLPVDEASGGVANFDTDVALPLIDVKAEIKAVETGTGAKSPSNPYIISGFSQAVITRCGKNLFDKSKMVIASQRFVKYGVDNYNDTLPNGKFKLQANQAYTFSFSGANSTNFESIGVYDEAGTRVSVVYNNNIATFTPDSTGAYFLAFAVSAGNWGGTWDNYDIQLELGSMATAYEAYTATQTTIALGQTVYGGYVEQDKDGKRELVVTHGRFVCTGEKGESWEYYNVAQGHLFRRYFNPSVKNVTITSDNTLCDKYTPIATSSRANLTVSGVSQMVDFINNDFTDLASFKADLANNPISIVIPIATPFTVSLPDGEPILAFNGVNNVWNDTNGATTVKYKLGIQKYIDKKIAEVQALVL